MSPYETVLQALRLQGHTVRNGMTTCPAHDDSQPSLHVTDKGEQVLLYCHAGCETEAVLAALGLDWRDTFASDDAYTRTSPEPLAEYTYKTREGQPHMVVGRFPNKKFLQRLPGGTWRQGLGSTKPCLYRMERIDEVLRTQRPRLAKRPDWMPQPEVNEYEPPSINTVWIVEGEKDVHAMELLLRQLNRDQDWVTTAPGGAGKWRDYYTGWIADLQAYNITIIADNDSHGAGLEHAKKVLRSFHDWSLENSGPACFNGIGPTIMQPTAGKDMYDLVRMGLGLDGLVEYDDFEGLPVSGITGADLEAEHFDPPRWVLPDILQTGLAMLGGPPKMGKSYLVQDMALAVATGGKAWGNVTAVQGDVLYLSLDNDTKRRLQARQRDLMGGQPVNNRITYYTEWPRQDDAIFSIRAWAARQKDPRLVIVDTAVWVEPNLTSDRDAYRGTTDILARWNRLAVDLGVAIVFVHHDRKSTDEVDWVNNFLGSRGITASVTTLMFLSGKRGEQTAELKLTGRDLETDDLTLTRIQRQWQVFEGPTASISHLGEPAQRVIGVVQRRAANGEQTTLDQVCEELDDLAREVIRVHLSNAVKAERIQRVSRGLYMGVA